MCLPDRASGAMRDVRLNRPPAADSGSGITAVTAVPGVLESRDVRLGDTPASEQKTPEPAKKRGFWKKILGIGNDKQ